ncbi:hypothetical protein H4R19_004534 [Coemansia spiralis]|nr:hypothetical protein H4R19_004534 [Coemansia spiralis]
MLTCAILSVVSIFCCAGLAGARTVLQQPPRVKTVIAAAASAVVANWTAMVQPGLLGFDFVLRGKPDCAYMVRSVALSLARSLIRIQVELPKRDFLVCALPSRLTYCEDQPAGVKTSPSGPSTNTNELGPNYAANEAIQGAMTARNDAEVKPMAIHAANLAAAEQRCPAPIPDSNNDSAGCAIVQLVASPEQGSGAPETFEKPDQSNAPVAGKRQRLRKALGAAVLRVVDAGRRAYARAEERRACLPRKLQRKVRAH